MSESEHEKDRPINPYATVSTVSHTDPISPKVSIPLAVGLAVLILLACIVNLGLGISLLLVSVPAYIRAANSSFQKVLAGAQLSTSDRVQAFVSSVVVVGVCAIAGGIGFFATCVGVLVVGSAGAGAIEANIGSEAIVLLAILICGIGFFSAAGVVYWLFWPRRKRL